MTGSNRTGFAPSPKYFCTFALLFFKVITACRKCRIHPIKITILCRLKLHKHHITPAICNGDQKLPTLGCLQNLIKSTGHVAHKILSGLETSIADLLTMVSLNVD